MIHGRSWVPALLVLLQSAPLPAQSAGSQPARTLHTAVRGVGYTGIHIVGTEVVHGLMIAGFGRGNDLWVVRRHTPATGNYDEVWASPLYAGREFDALLVGDVEPAAGVEILVVDRTGSVEIWNLAQRQLLRTFQAPIQRSTSLAAAALRDLDGDGALELLLGSDADDLRVYSLAGTPLWTVPGVRTRELVVAEMDGDAGIEIATTDGKVIDAATRLVEWTVAPELGTLAAADVDQDGRAELFWRDGGQTRVVDVDLRTSSFTIPYSGTRMQVADVDGDGGIDLVINSQLNGQAVYDLTTRAQRWRGIGVDGLFALGDPDADGRREIVSGTGRGTSPPSDRLYVIDAPTGVVEHQSLQPEGPFYNLRHGELDGDPDPELVVSSSGRGARLWVLDARTLAIESAHQNLWFGDGDLEDVDGDGRHEVFTANYSLTVQRYDASTRTWNAIRQYAPANTGWRIARLADVDGDGNRELLAFDELYLYCFDRVTGQQLGRTAFFLLNVTDLQVGDTDADGAADVHVLAGGDVYVFTGTALRTTAVLQFGTWPYTSVQALPLGGPAALLLGDAQGQLRVHLPGPGRPVVGPFAVTSPEPIHRLEAVLSPVFLLLVSDGQRLAFHDDIVGVLLGTAQPVWTSDARGGTFGRQHVLRVPDGAVYTTSNAGVFRYEPR